MPPDRNEGLASGASCCRSLNALFLICRPSITTPRLLIHYSFVVSVTAFVQPNTLQFSPSIPFFVYTSAACKCFQWSADVGTDT